jgi:hypothetical protein
MTNRNINHELYENNSMASDKAIAKAIMKDETKKAGIRRSEADCVMEEAEAEAIQAKTTESENKAYEKFYKADSDKEEAEAYLVAIANAYYSVYSEDSDDDDYSDDET